MELSVTVNRNSFNWGTEATQAIQKFFEVERQAKELFSENKLYEIIKFYTTDEVKKSMKYSALLRNIMKKSI